VAFALVATVARPRPSRLVHALASVATTSPIDWGSRKRIAYLGLVFVACQLAGCTTNSDPADNSDPAESSNAVTNKDGEGEVAAPTIDQQSRITKPKVSTPLIKSTDTQPVERGPELFVDVTQGSGIDFVHFNGAGGDYTLAEITGSGGALFDFDNDGDLDIYLVQGQMIKASQPTPKNIRLGNRLYRNDTLPGEKMKFTDVTDRSGAEAPGYGMGVASGDFDHDGWVDLYVTNLGSNCLLKNNGDGSFIDVTNRSGCDDPRWSTSASFVDVDNDGWLDLFIANYVDFSADVKRECFSNSSARDYCGPDAYDAVSDRLLRNRADGTFEDITDKAGMGQVKSAGLGVVAADFNGDGWVDIYVANDGDANHLWLNQKGSGVFKDGAPLAGVAVNRSGTPEASMGVDAADVDGDGDMDLFMTHLERESNTFYVNLGNAVFDDRTIEMGLHAPSLTYTSFGTRFCDYDNDGFLDLFVLNGAVRTIRSLALQGDPYPLHQRNQLFRNNGTGFMEVSQKVGPAFEASHVSRGAAFGDVDNDGDTDVLICNNNGPVQLLLNQRGSNNNWLGIRVLDAEGRSDVLQTRIQVVDAAGNSLWRRVHTDGSYCSASDPRVIVGLGNRTKVPSVIVHWPDGKTQRWADLPTNQYTTLRRSRSEPKDRKPK
jgi:hypothetical protein